jgi:hypothetical protein
MYVKPFEEFINEMANLSQEVLKFKAGDAIVITQRFSMSDLDFSKSARTLWGQKIASSLNVHMKLSADSQSYQYKYEPGDVLFVFSKSGQVNNKGLAKITGYMGGFGYANDDTPAQFRNSGIEVTLDYDDFLTQTIILSLLEGKSKQISFNQVSKDSRESIQTHIKVNRIITRLVKRKPIKYDDMEITSYNTMGEAGIEFIGFDKDSGDKLPNKLVKWSNIRAGKFLETSTGKEITGNPVA